MNTQINVYKNLGEWCYALYIDGQYDHSDSVPDVTAEDEQSDVEHALIDNYAFAAHKDVEFVRVEDTSIA